jgi:hypothetical protein
MNIREVIENLRTAESTYGSDFSEPIIGISEEERDVIVKNYDHMCRISEELVALSKNKFEKK